MSSRTLLVDGDVVAYRIASTSEKPIEWEQGIWTLHSDFGLAQDQLDEYLEVLMIDLDADDMIICLSCRTSHYFRHDLLPTYKGNRAGKRKPLILNPLKDHLHVKYETFERPNLEADDCLGILLTHPKIIDGEKVCVSIDKDMKTLPGLHADLLDRDVFKVDEREADYWHLYQALCGDSTDGYKGCPTVGPKKAEVILEDFESVDQAWPKIVEAFKKQKLGEDEALLQARIARILRHTDYNFKKKEPILWKP